MTDVDHNISGDERPEKRQKIDEDHPAAAAAEQDGEGPPPPPPSQQISQALSKIANHIGNSSKFSKASQLLRQLMDAIDKSHRNAFFHVIACAFATPDHCIDPLLRKDYVRLLKAINIRSEVLSKQQRAQLEVYNSWGLLRNELFTDDSFMYNKVLAKIKTAISELSDGDEQQEEAWAALHGVSKSNNTPKQQQQQQKAESTAAPAPAAGAAVEDEADPFGLNEFLAREEAAAAAKESEEAAAAAAATAAAAAAEPISAASEDAAAAGASSSIHKSCTWDPASIQVMKKQALLDCIITARTHQHKLAWARTSIEMLIEEVAKPGVQGGLADKFVGGQKQQLQELLQFVHCERAARKSGVNRRPGGKGTGEYMTSFERARAEWSAASWVSTRGKVGSAGDAKANNWLG